MGSGKQQTQRKGERGFQDSCAGRFPGGAVPRHTATTRPAGAAQMARGVIPKMNLNGRQGALDVFRKNLDT